MIGLMAVAGVVAALGAVAAVTYRRSVETQTRVERSWEQVEVELQSRFEFMLELVKAVRGHAPHGRRPFTRLVEARSGVRKAVGQGPLARQGPEQELSAALSAVIALADAYPALLADQTFNELRETLSRIEDRIVTVVEIHNAAVDQFNALISKVPASLIAALFRFPRIGRFQFERATQRPAAGRVA